MVVLLVVVAGGVVSESTVMVPMNLTLCNETSENVSRLMTDVYLVQPQQHDYCEQINISTPVVSCHVINSNQLALLVAISSSSSSSSSSGSSSSGHAIVLPSTAVTCGVPCIQRTHQ